MLFFIDLISHSCLCSNYLQLLLDVVYTHDDDISSGDLGVVCRHNNDISRGPTVRSPRLTTHTHTH